MQEMSLGRKEKPRKKERASVCPLENWGWWLTSEPGGRRMMMAAFVQSERLGWLELAGKVWAEKGSGFD